MSQDEEMATDGGEESAYAPGARDAISEAEAALDAGDRDRAREALAFAHAALVESQANEMEMSESLKEALEAAIDENDISEIPELKHDDPPDEWTVEGVHAGEIPVVIDRELQRLPDDILWRITSEASDREGMYRIRFERLPFEQN
jgi:hypothetical protein